VETPPISDQLQAMVTQVQSALPNILALTNQLAAVLSNSVVATSNLERRPCRSAAVADQFHRHQRRSCASRAACCLGAGHKWQRTGARHFDQRQFAARHTDTNLTAILIHLSDITSNLNAQVQANSNMLGSVSKIVVDTDDFSRIEAALVVALGVQKGKSSAGTRNS
jgi:hypothetical protein